MSLNNNYIYYAYKFIHTNLNNSNITNVNLSFI